MDEATYRQLFEQFLHRYWGAFHEVLEAQSVTPSRLAGSLFSALRNEHDAFAESGTRGGSAEPCTPLERSGMPPPPNAWIASMRP
jgi:hypothetical protein